MIRIIAKTIASVQPHGEPLIIHRTFDVDLPEVEAWLMASGYAREVVAVEVRRHEVEEFESMARTGIAG